eukprot:TRINITY_DN3144_c0_g1_i3.p3 TRINITY_DN3144_c0_g1~~TRINITY_DN3144_c0_g1_i3.p3  ORF type:complete len:314 (-),score=39.68 TRINITY_DN3144_c0_g1_i3:1519-2424(-)
MCSARLNISKWSVGGHICRPCRTVIGRLTYRFQLNLVKQVKTQRGKFSVKASYDSVGQDAGLRSEVEAPFRVFRLVMYGFFALSAGIAGLISLPQLIGALGGAPKALPVEQVLQNLGIDWGAVGVFLILFRGDWQARQKQIARIMREDTLARQKVELSNGKVIQLGLLRSLSRPVIIAGTPEQVVSGIESAQQYKEQLQERGVFIVGCPIFEGEGETQPLTKDDLRWLGKSVVTDQWRKWFDEQMALAEVDSQNGLYVGLRIDGRVRASGKGIPPWPVFIAQLPPMEGMWKGLLDGMDGRV